MHVPSTDLLFIQLPMQTIKKTVFTQDVQDVTIQSIKTLVH